MSCHKIKINQLLLDTYVSIILSQFYKILFVGFEFVIFKSLGRFPSYFANKRYWEIIGRLGFEDAKSIKKAALKFKMAAGFSQTALFFFSVFLIDNLYENWLTTESARATTINRDGHVFSAITFPAESDASSILPSLLFFFLIGCFSIHELTLTLTQTRAGRPREPLLAHAKTSASR